MFENLKITSAAASDRLEVNLQWKWKYIPGGPTPSCEVFCYTIPENQLLRDSVFSQEEIIRWVVENKGIDIASPETQRENLRAFCRNPMNRNVCRLNRYTLNSGGNDVSVQRLEYPLSDIDKIFFLCIFGEKTFETRVFAIDTKETCIPYDFSGGRKFLGMFGGGRKMISFHDSGNRRRVLISRYQNEEVYSILPGGDTYYLDDSVSQEDIVRVVYLSSLIGN